MSLNLCLKLNKKQIYIISVSGGVDSMVLLDYLYNLEYHLVVVHFNHLQRSNSLKDKVLIESYCQNKKIPFNYFELNIEKKDFQNKARILRKRKLKEVASYYKTFYLITAHHLDDLAETFLFKISRGSSILGYSGMHLSNYVDNFYFIKPFLYVTKQDIIDYAKKNNVPFLEDYTNKLNIYTRNKIRNQIIPHFKEMHNFLNNIKKMHIQFKEVHDFIRKETHLFIAQKKKNNIFDLNLFLKLDIVIQKDIILFFLEEKKIKSNFHLITNLVVFLKNKYKPNGKYYFNSEWQLIKEYNFFWWGVKNINKQIEPSPKPLLFVADSDNLLLDCFIKQKIFYDEENITTPLILRRRRPGDVLKFTFGTQKLKKFFINSKIPLNKRDNFWLIIDQKNNIIWIPHLYVNNVLGKSKKMYIGLYKG